MYTEEIKRHTSSTDHVITGSFEDVIQGIRDVFASWHPAGYSTAVARMHMVDYSGYIAVVTRANSCE